MARRKRKSTRRKSTKRSRPMRNGECRVTKNGMEYCKVDGEVQFTQSVGGLSGGRSRSRSRSRGGTKGKTCQRFKRVQVKGTKGKARRCASFG